MCSIAVVPARMKRSPQESAAPYFSLIGHSNPRALSRFVLSSQLLQLHTLRQWILTSVRNDEG